MKNLLLALLFVGCTPDPSGPPCVSTTGTVCHAVEVLAYEHCACDGLAADEVLECMYPVMRLFCEYHDCSAQYDRWEQLNACTVEHECYDDCGL